AVINGTAALQLGLRLVGAVGRATVVTSPLTFVATTNAIQVGGASPIFCDVDPDTWTMSPAALARLLATCTRRADGWYAPGRDGPGRAIVPVHIFGIPCDPAAIDEIAQQAKTPVVVAACEGLATEIRRERTPAYGTVACFSFNGNKLVTSGGGG